MIRAYALALATGENENGKKLRADLEKKMTKEQIEQGKKEYERLKSAPPPEKSGDKPVPPATPAPADGKKKVP